MDDSPDVRVKRFRILVVEDDPNIRSMCANVLRDEGYLVETAVDGEDALAHLAAPDLIILDLMMPFMDGREFLRRLRPVTPAEGPPVLIMTALSVRGGVEGAQDLMTKPFDMADLVRHVERLIG